VLARRPVLEIGAELLPRAARSAAQELEAPPSPTAHGDTLDAHQRRHILDVLAETNWVVEGRAGAAARLGIKASALRSRMQKLGIRWVR